MSRRPRQTREALDDDGREVGLDPRDTGIHRHGQGAVMGPFNAWVTAAGSGGRLAELGATLRFARSRTADDERGVDAVAGQLVEHDHVDRGMYDAARELLGDRGTVELAPLGVYDTLVSFILNVVRCDRAACRRAHLARRRGLSPVLPEPIDAAHRVLLTARGDGVLQRRS